MRRAFTSLPVTEWACRSFLLSFAVLITAVYIGNNINVSRPWRLEHRVVCSVKIYGPSVGLLALRASCSAPFFKVSLFTVSHSKIKSCRTNRRRQRCQERHFCLDGRSNMDILRLLLLFSASSVLIDFVHFVHVEVISSLAQVNLQYTEVVR